MTEAGKQGEICVVGTALALGYYRNEEKTSQAFVQNPLNDCYPELMYRTGDLGRYDEQGDLYYITRKDFQIKHMGHRIELGEIEVSFRHWKGLSGSAAYTMSRKTRLSAFMWADWRQKKS